MAAAETAKMISELELRDKFTPTANKAIAKTTQLEKSLARTGTRIQTGTNKAFSNLQGRVKGLTAAIGPLVGVGGLLGVTSLLASSVNEASKFGDAVLKVQKVTNLTAQTASAMVDTLDKWGVSSDRLLPILGKMEKNVGAITDKTGGAKKFQDQYGVSLLTTSGRIADANTLLLRSADYFNSNATATDKATFMSKLWGKAWQDLIPILSKGSKFIKEQERTAIHLTTTQLANIAKFRTAQRDFADAFGDLQVKIGSEIMPLITTGLTEITRWFDANESKVTAFFHDAAVGAGDFAKSAGQIFAGLKASWESIPPDVRDFLVKGLVADRVVKFLFGFSPITFAAGALTKGLSGLFGQFAARGSSPANPLWVQTAGGLPGGLPGGGGGGIAGKLVRGALPVAIVALGAEVALQTSGILQANHQFTDPETGQTRVFRGTNVLAEKIANVSNNIKSLEARAAAGDQVAQRQLDGQRVVLERLLAEQTQANDTSQDQIEKQRAAFTGFSTKLSRLPAAIRAVLRGRTAAQLRAQEETARRGGLRVNAVAKGGSDALTVIDYMTALAVKGTSPWYKKADNIKRAIDAAKAAQRKAIADGNTTLARKFAGDIKILQGVVDDIKPAVDRTTNAINVQTLAMAGQTGAIVGAIAGIKPPIVNVNVSATTVNKTTNVQNRYGETNGSRGQHFGDNLI